MADSIREKIGQSLERILETILVSGGYNVDSGLNVNRAKRNYSEDDLPAVSLWLGAESVKNEYGNDKRTMIVDIESHYSSEDAVVSDDVLINRLIADIEKCIGTYDTVLMGLIDGLKETNAEPIYPGDGSDIIAARLTYEIKYQTVKGDPATQP